jgi:hypothetical protein
VSTIPDIFGRGVRDPLCPQGHVIETATDRRLLWHLARELSGGVTKSQRDIGWAAERYLHVTCEHHWHEHLKCCEPAEGCPPPHRQCLWCNDVEWATGDPERPWSAGLPGGDR